MREWKTIWDHEIAHFGRRSIHFTGLTSPYVLKVDEADQQDVVVIHEGGGEADRWSISTKEVAGEIIRLSGMTGGWADGLRSPWFQLTLGYPAVLHFYGDQVLLREDVEVQSLLPLSSTS